MYEHKLCCMWSSIAFLLAPTQLDLQNGYSSHTRNGIADHYSHLYRNAAGVSVQKHPGLCAEAILLFCLLAGCAHTSIQRLLTAPGTAEAADHRLLPGVAKREPRLKVAKDQVRLVSAR